MFILLHYKPRGSLFFKRSPVKHGILYLISNFAEERPAPNHQTGPCHCSATTWTESLMLMIKDITTFWAQPRSRNIDVWIFYPTIMYDGLGKTKIPKCVMLIVTTAPTIFVIFLYQRTANPTRLKFVVHFSPFLSSLRVCKRTWATKKAPWNTEHTFGIQRGPW